MKLYVRSRNVFQKKTSHYQYKLTLEGDIKKTRKIIKQVIGIKRGTFGSFSKT